MMRTDKAWELLNELADRECTCTEAQKGGDDPTECLRCEAAGEVNRIGEDIRQTARFLIAKACD